MRTPLKAIYLPAIALALAFLPARAQETLNSVQRELDRVDKEIQREKDLNQAERKRAAEFEQEKGAKLKALKEQIQLGQARIDSLKRQLDAAKRQKQGQKGQIAFYQGKQKDFAKNLAKQARDLAAYFRKDFPYQRERRVADLQDLAASLDNGAVQVEDGVNKLFAELQSAVDLGYDAEAYAGNYRATDGKGYSGDYVRLGAALMAFASQDGKCAAFLAKTDTGYAWVDQGLDQATREDIAKAVRVAGGKLPPDLAAIPFAAPKAKGVNP